MGPVAEGKSRDWTCRAPMLDDAVGVAALFNVCSQVALGVEEINADTLRASWLYPGFALEKDARLVLTPEGRVVGYVAMWGRSDLFYVANWLDFRVHPACAAHEVGPRLLRWAEATACRKAASVSPQCPVVLRTGALHAQQAYCHLFEQAGFALSRHFFMMQITMDAPPPLSPAPDGIRILTQSEFNDQEALARAVDETFVDHWGYDQEPFEHFFADWMHWVKTLNEDYAPSLWFLAMDGDEIAGMSLGIPRTTEDPAMGYLDTLGVRPSWRRRGIGLALLRHTFHEFFRRGTRKVALHVDSESQTGATRLYEKAGMRVARQYDMYEKEIRPGADLNARAVEGQSVVEGERER